MKQRQRRTVVPRLMTSTITLFEGSFHIPELSQWPRIGSAELPDHTARITVLRHASGQMVVFGAHFIPLTEPQRGGFVLPASTTFAEVCQSVSEVVRRLGVDVALAERCVESLSASGACV
jgi:hypothetical protein